MSKASIINPGAEGKRLLFIDAKKAHLNPRCDEEVYIELPPEAKQGESKCGRLNFWLYGFRSAGRAWEEHYAQKLVEAGFVRGKACPVVFRDEARDVDCVIHGDDFVMLGTDKELDWIA